MALRVPPAAIFNDPRTQPFVIGALVLLINCIVQQAQRGNLLPFDISSWYRDRQSNMDAGGVANSFHLFGGAFDLTGEGAIQIAICWFLAGFQVVNEGDHWHLEFDQRRPLLGSDAESTLFEETFGTTRPLFQFPPDFVPVQG